MRKANLSKVLLLTLGITTALGASAQETEKVDTLQAHEQRLTLLEDAMTQSKKLKFSGYVQAQWQRSQIDSTGSKAFDMRDGLGKNQAETNDPTYSRFGMRRGRLKATYTDFGCQAVVEIDVTESQVRTRDLYLSALDPWVNVLAVKGGIFDRPFGFEIGYSSAKTESAERSRIVQTLFPDEKDMGLAIALQAPKTSPWNVFRLEAGLLAGNAINKDYKDYKDFCAHLTYNKSTSNVSYGLGVSTYLGKILQLNKNKYTMHGGAFTVDSTKTNAGSYADRNYFGVDGQLSIASDLGLTQLRAEYMFGTQPGSVSKTVSPNGFDPTAVTAAQAATTAYDTYVRKFQGGYVLFVQDILDTKHSLVLKYDWYDPNVDIKGANIGKATKTSKADVAYGTFGIGYLYRMNNNIRLTAYYDIVRNEKVSKYDANLPGFTKDQKDNLLTIRMQYRF